MPDPLSNARLIVREQFIETISHYEHEQRIIAPMWTEIETHYSGEHRHYHNLVHLQKMLEHLLAVKDQIHHWHEVVLALCYHDIIYESLQHNNEEESAALAEKRLSLLAMHHTSVKLIANLILATKKHELHEDNDVNFFTDADLSILGADAATYDQYAADIRKEYAAVPDVFYVSGRISVLNHFLKMPALFKTAHFTELLEAQARINLERERQSLAV